MAYKKLSEKRKLQKFLFRFDSDMRLHDRHFLGTGDPVDDLEIDVKVIMGKVDTGLEKEGGLILIA
jgi:hypothetical protein